MPLGPELVQSSRSRNRRLVDGRGPVSADEGSSGGPAELADWVAVAGRAFRISCAIRWSSGTCAFCVRISRNRRSALRRHECPSRTLRLNSERVAWSAGWSGTRFPSNRFVCYVMVEGKDEYPGSGNKRSERPSSCEMTRRNVSSIRSRSRHLTCRMLQHCKSEM